MKHIQSSILYTQMGMAALLPGMQYALEQMQKLVEEFREQLAMLQNGAAKPSRKKIATGYWDKMTPEERSEEMKRRMTFRNGKPASHPRDPNHPKHAQWLKRVRAANRKAWRSLTPEQQREKMAKTHAGRVRQIREAS